VCREFIVLCRKLDLLSMASVAIDGSKFRAVNARDKNFTEAKMKLRLERIDERTARYLSQLETAGRHGRPAPSPPAPGPSASSPGRWTSPPPTSPADENVGSRCVYVAIFRNGETE